MSLVRLISVVDVDLFIILFFILVSQIRSIKQYNKILMLFFKIDVVSMIPYQLTYLILSYAYVTHQMLHVTLC